ncbi:MAG: InlB B-repeat-containing protein [Clostridia bacterium]|nr:InlB B-repeat-containing protein [Clostridia bacterium]
MIKTKSKLKMILLLASVLLVSVVFSACSLFSVNTVTVNFYDGEELVKTYSVFNAERIKPPSIEDKQGYKVVDWKDGEDVSFSQEYEFKSENDFHAVWAPVVYNVNYNLDGGVNAEDNPATYTVEDSFVLRDATKEDHTFMGWTSSAEPTPVKGLSVPAGTWGDLSFKANFAAVNTRYLYFQTNGGNELDHLETTGAFFGEAPNPTRTGYEFDGWYADENLLIPATFPLLATKTITTVYAKWTPIVYYVYVMDGVSETPIATIGYTIEQDVELGEPPLEGHTFNGYTEGTSSTLHKTFYVPVGSHRNYTLTMHYTVNEYTITFDSLGGSAVAPVTVEYGSAISAPTDPTKQNCDFTGWYTDALCSNKFVFSTMPAANITLYAGWESDQNFRLSYSPTDADAVISGNRASGAEFLAGESVELTAPLYCDGGVFTYWTSGGNIYNYSNELKFPMPTNSLSLVANYASAITYGYDKTVGGNLTLGASFNLTSFGGGRARSGDYTISGKSAILKESYLRSLEEGYYTYVLTGASAAAYAIVQVDRGAGSVTNLKIDYDLNYPAVTLTFDGKKGATYEYSMDGSSFVIAESGVILGGYNKNSSHTVTVRDKDNVSDSATVTKSAYNNRVSSYVNSSYEYGGEKYDLYIESRQELNTIIEYIVYVYAPQNRSRKSGDYPGGYAGLTFGLSPEFETELRNNEEKYFSYLFSQGGAPYAPAYRRSISNQTATLTIYFTTDTPNSVRSSQQIVEVSNAQNLLKTSSRPNDYNGFKINSFEKTQNIRTLYELENLPFGVKPTFSDNESQAYQVYDKAKEILRRYVDDSMNDFEKVAAIYDYISLNHTYDQAASTQSNVKEVGKFAAFTSYGMLMHGVAVCDGIASAFKILCMIEGIESIEVPGYGNGEAHAWNKVKVYGQWYCVDATWSHVNVRKNYSTDVTVYVTHKYLLTDDATNTSFGHSENALLDNEDEIFVDNVAIGALNYFTIEFLGDKIDYSAGSTNDLYGIFSAAYSGGATAIEVRWTGSASQMSMALSSASSRLRKSVTYSELGDGIYLYFIS